MAINTLKVELNGQNEKISDELDALGKTMSKIEYANCSNNLESRMDINEKFVARNDTEIK